MKYLDLVELIKEKPAYTKAGVKLGDFGAIMSEKPINGKWQVIFYSHFLTKILSPKNICCQFLVQLLSKFAPKED